jgi:nucleoside-diphosphate-sugar epimerase
MILVTGGTGLVGAHLLFKLTSENEAVRAIYRSEHKFKNVKQVFKSYTEDIMPLFDKIEWVKADILDLPSLEVAFADVTFVYHCAAFVSFEPDKYKLLRCTNIEGTANIVNFCISSPTVKKLCHVSSIAAIGTPIRATSTTEKTVWQPEEDHSVYAITKYGAELEVWRGTQEGLDAVIINPGVILGAGIWHYGSGYIFKKVHSGLRYYTSGSIGLISVQDVVAIMVQLLKSKHSEERYILVAENWSYATFLKSVAKALKVAPPQKLAPPWLLQIGWRLDWFTHKVLRKRRSLSKNLARTLTSTLVYDNSKLKSTLDFKFTPITDAIDKVSKAYLKQEQ